ncbi:hypothetical protein V1512DRAFT_253676 [Lipomyces arxii]|uniref:uncharacterized protein n=1 Tax=Lipomyces arxii TaxID=56418 RepID=UPI0034CF110F
MNSSDEQIVPSPGHHPSVPKRSAGHQMTASTPSVPRRPKPRSFENGSDGSQSMTLTPSQSFETSAPEIAASETANAFPVSTQDEYVGYRPIEDASQFASSVPMPIPSIPRRPYSPSVNLRQPRSLYETAQQEAEIELDVSRTLAETQHRFRRPDDSASGYEGMEHVTSMISDREDDSASESFSNAELSGSENTISEEPGFLGYMQKSRNMLSTIPRQPMSPSVIEQTRTTNAAVHPAMPKIPARPRSSNQHSPITRSTSTNPIVPARPRTDTSAFSAASVASNSEPATAEIADTTISDDAMPVLVPQPLEPISANTLSKGQDVLTSFDVAAILAGEELKKDDNVREDAEHSQLHVRIMDGLQEPEASPTVPLPIHGFGHHDALDSLRHDYVSDSDEEQVDEIGAEMNNDTAAISVGDNMSPEALPKLTTSLESSLSAVALPQHTTNRPDGEFEAAEEGTSYKIKQKNVMSEQQGVEARDLEIDNLQAEEPSMEKRNSMIESKTDDAFAKIDKAEEIMFDTALTEDLKNDSGIFQELKPVEKRTHETSAPVVDARSTDLEDKKVRPIVHQRPKLQLTESSDPATSIIGLSHTVTTHADDNTILSATKPKPPPPARPNKLTGIRAAFAKNLESQFGKAGPPLPFQKRPVPVPQVSQAVDPDTGTGAELKSPERPGVVDATDAAVPAKEVKLDDVRKGRARGPRGRKLPAPVILPGGWSFSPVVAVWTLAYTVSEIRKSETTEETVEAGLTVPAVSDQDNRADASEAMVSDVADLQHRVVEPSGLEVATKQMKPDADFVESASADSAAGTEIMPQLLPETETENAPNQKPRVKSKETTELPVQVQVASSAMAESEFSPKTNADILDNLTSTDIVNEDQALTDLGSTAVVLSELPTKVDEFEAAAAADLE